MLQEKKIVKNPIKAGSFNDIYSIGFHGVFLKLKTKILISYACFFNEISTVCFCKVLMKWLNVFNSKSFECL